MENTNTKELLEKRVEEINAFGNHTKKFHFNYGHCMFTFAGLITGCGLVQMNGNTFLQNTDLTKEKFIKLYRKAEKDSHNDRAGAIIATLGDSHMYSSHNTYYSNNRHHFKMLELGFERISTYDNYFHEKGYQQYLYILKLNDGW